MSYLLEINSVCHSKRPKTTLRRSRGFTLIELLVVIAIIAIFNRIAAPGRTTGARSSAPVPPAKNNMKQLGLALHNYHDAHTKFPYSSANNAMVWTQARRSDSEYIRLGHCCCLIWNSLLFIISSTSPQPNATARLVGGLRTSAGNSDGGVCGHYRLIWN